jgi:NADH:ubiquinone oxidoreductase subunit 6 (subunit J)
MPHGTLLAAFSPEPASLIAFLLPVAFGAVAVYCLLPRTRPYPPLLGVSAGGIAFLLAGWLVVRAGVMSVETVLFLFFAGVAMVSGGLLISQHNPVRAALSFALVILSTCGLFLLQAAPFLMAATIIVYAGAIIVTFLFVIMLAQQTGLSDADVRSREPLLSCIAGFVLLGALLAVLHANYDTRGLDTLVARAERASQAATVNEIRAALGGEQEFIHAYREELNKLGPGGEPGNAVDEALAQFQAQLASPRPDDERVRQALQRLVDAGLWLRQSYGSLPPPPSLAMSGYSGVPANQVGRMPRDARGHLPMPAENVRWLGTSLFTDFLLAVELGGTLLLVATVGAIAIAGRRTEGVR